MLEALYRIRLLYVVLAVLLLVGLLPLGLAGTMLSRRRAEELRAIEGRYHQLGGTRPGNRAIRSTFRDL